MTYLHFTDRPESTALDFRLYAGDRYRRTDDLTLWRVDAVMVDSHFHAFMVLCDPSEAEAFGNWHKRNATQDEPVQQELI